VSDDGRLVSSCSVFYILITAGVHDIGDNDSADVVVEYKHPHADYCNGQPIGDEKDRFVLEAVANADGSNDETRVREDHGPPPEMEVFRT
jgi:hypothetical protein